MPRNKKPSPLEIFMVVCCALGITLMVLPKFIETPIELATIGIAFNGVGIFALLKVITDKSKAPYE